MSSGLPSPTAKDELSKRRKALFWLSEGNMFVSDSMLLTLSANGTLVLVIICTRSYFSLKSARVGPPMKRLNRLRLDLCLLYFDVTAALAPQHYVISCDRRCVPTICR